MRVRCFQQQSYNRTEIKIVELFPFKDSNSHQGSDVLETKQTISKTESNGFDAEKKEGRKSNGIVD